MTMENLFEMEDKCGNTKFFLVDAVSSAWFTIGEKLGIQKEVLNSIEVTRDTNKQRLGQVWKMWLEESDLIANNMKYPSSWRGLRRLLADSGEGNIAKEFFEYLDKL